MPRTEHNVKKVSDFKYMTTGMVDRVYVKKTVSLMHHAVNKIQKFNTKCCVRQKENNPEPFF